MLVLGGYDDAQANDLTSTSTSVSRDGTTVTHVAAGRPADLDLPRAAADARRARAARRAAPRGHRDPRPADDALVSRAPPARRRAAARTSCRSRRATGISPQAMLIGGAEHRRRRRAATRRPTARTLRLRRPQAARGLAAGRAAAPPAQLAQHRAAARRRHGRPSAAAPRITARDAAFTRTCANRRVELWDQRTKRWRSGPAQREDRTYHSVAMVLPDGRVWSAGDDANPNRDGDTAELYEPPYLFRGRAAEGRPGPGTVAPRTRFTVTTSAARSADARDAAGARARRPTRCDMNQRFVELKVVQARAGRHDAGASRVDRPAQLRRRPARPVHALRAHRPRRSVHGALDPRRVEEVPGQFVSPPVKQTGLGPSSQPRRWRSSSRSSSLECIAPMQLAQRLGAGGDDLGGTVGRRPRRPGGRAARRPPRARAARAPPGSAACRRR